MIVFYTLLASCLLYLSYALLTLSLHAYRQRKLALANNCAPVPKDAHFAGAVWDPLNLRFLFRTLQASQSRTLLAGCQSLYTNLGNTWTVSVLGNTVISTVDPDNLRTIFSSRMNDWHLGDYRSKTFNVVLGDSIFTSDGNAWSHARAFLRPTFRKVSVGDLSAYEKHVSRLVAALRPMADGRTTVNLQDWFYKLTMDAATEILFGESLDSLLWTPGANGAESHDPAQVFAHQYEEAKTMVFKNLQIYPLHLLKSQKKLQAAADTIHAFVDRYVDMALDWRKSYVASSATKTAPGQPRLNFIQELSKYTSDPVKIRFETMTMLLAGRDTTAILLANIFWVLSQRPDIQAKLRAEIDPLNGLPPTTDDFVKMSYLHGVIKESLRIHPVIPLNARTAVVDTILPTGGGPDRNQPIFVPKGTQANLSTHALHRLPSVWGPDADEFKPERWDNGWKPPAWTYLPFSAGPRVCPGQGMAMTEAMYTTVRLLQEFADVSGDQTEYVEDLSITCANLKGAEVKLKQG